MNRLEVMRAGPLTSVQAKPRTGFLAAGVSPSGPMDQAAYEIAQALVGNDGDAAALEFAQFGGSYRVGEDCLFAVTGGACAVTCDGHPVPGWESHHIRAGQRLDVGAMRDGVWGYIAFSGGIDVPTVLGSRATHLRNGMGGFEGRALQTGDRLKLGESGMTTGRRLTTLFHRARGPVRVIAGPQDDWFSRKAWGDFLGEPYSLSPKRDRMASLLDGPFLKSDKGHDIISDGTPAGSIQVPGSGQPLVLGAERQTTGGYPKIATVISADLPRLAQMPAGTAFRFVRVDRDEAEELLLEDRIRLKQAIDTLAD